MSAGSAHEAECGEPPVKRVCSDAETRQSQALAMARFLIDSDESSQSQSQSQAEGCGEGDEEKSQGHGAEARAEEEAEGGDDLLDDEVTEHTDRGKGKEPLGGAESAGSKVCSEGGTKEGREEKNEFVGFVMGGKKVAPPSKEAMERARAMFGDEGGDEPSKKDTGFTGFVMGGKKIAPPSKEALERARAMFGDEGNDEQRKETGFTGFVMGGKKIAPPSKEAMERARVMFGDEGSDEQSKKDTGFTGFVMGGKKIAPPSKEALERARAMFGDEGNDEPSKKDTGFTGFVMGGKKIAPPSKEAMEKARAMFDHSEENTNESIVTPLKGCPRTEKTATLRTETNEDDDMISTQLAADFLDEMSHETTNKSHGEPATPKQQRVKPVIAQSVPRFRRHKGQETPLHALLAKQNKTLQYPASVTQSAPQGLKSRRSLGLLTLRKQPPKQIQFTPEKEKPKEEKEKGSTEPPRPTLETLKDRFVACTLPELYSHGVLAAAVGMNSLTAGTFKFRVVDFPTLDDKWAARAKEGLLGWEEFVEPVAETFSPSSPQLVKPVWVKNHFRWIVWKMAAMERSFPTVYGGKYLTPDNVLAQLGKRFETEVIRAKRSALKRIYERDGVSTRLLVLCVASVQPSTGGAAPPQQEQEDGQKAAAAAAAAASAAASAPAAAAAVQQKEAMVEMTDGWYSIQCRLDGELTKYLEQGKIYVGQKLRIFGAQRSESEGVSPLEDGAAAVFLRITRNGTRRAKWHERLGFHKHRTFPVRLSSITPEGGAVPAIDVVVLRKLPTLFVERNGESKTVRTESEELEAAAEHNRKMQAEYQKYVESGDMDAAEDMVNAPPRDVFPLQRILVRECPAFLKDHPELSQDYTLPCAVVTVRTSGTLVDAFTEGCWARLFHVMVTPFPPRGALRLSADMLALQLTVDASMPRLEFSTPAVPTGPTMVPRRCLSADQVAACCTPGTVFDYTGLVLGRIVQQQPEATAEGSKTQVSSWLFCTDTSAQILAINVTTNAATTVDEGALICAENLVFSNIDSRYQHSVAEASDIAVLDSRQPHLTASLHILQSWLKLFVFFPIFCIF